MQSWVYNCGLTVINNRGLQIITNYNQELGMQEEFQR